MKKTLLFFVVPFCMAACSKQHNTSLSDTGTAANPVLTEVKSYTLPTAGGHDLSPYYHDAGKLWISTGSKGYLFDKTTNSFQLAPGAANGVGVKAVSNQPIGQIVETKPASGGCSDGWSTKYGHFL